MLQNLSSQGKAAEPKRSKPWEGGCGGGLDFEERSRRVKRELMAAAAEKRLMSCAAVAKKSEVALKSVEKKRVEIARSVEVEKSVVKGSEVGVEKEGKGADLG